MSIAPNLVGGGRRKTSERRWMNVALSESLTGAAADSAGLGGFSSVCGVATSMFGDSSWLKECTSFLRLAPDWGLVLRWNPWALLTVRWRRLARPGRFAREGRRLLRPCPRHRRAGWPPSRGPRRDRRSFLRAC